MIQYVKCKECESVIAIELLRRTGKPLNFKDENKLKKEFMFDVSMGNVHSSSPLPLDEAYFDDIPSLCVFKRLIYCGKCGIGHIISITETPSSLEGLRIAEPVMEIGCIKIEMKEELRCSNCEIKFSLQMIRLGDDLTDLINNTLFIMNDGEMQITSESVEILDQERTFEFNLKCFCKNCEKESEVIWTVPKSTWMETRISKYKSKKDNRNIHSVHSEKDMDVNAYPVLFHKGNSTTEPCEYERTKVSKYHKTNNMNSLIFTGVEEETIKVHPNDIKITTQHQCRICGKENRISFFESGDHYYIIGIDNYLVDNNVAERQLIYSITNPMMIEKILYSYTCPNCTASCKGKIHGGFYTRLGWFIDKTQIFELSKIALQTLKFKHHAIEKGEPEKENMITLYGKALRNFNLNENKILYEKNFRCGSSEGCGQNLNIKIFASNTGYMITINNILVSNGLAWLSGDIDPSKSYIHYDCPICRCSMTREIEIDIDHIRKQQRRIITDNVFRTLKKYSFKYSFKSIFKRLKRQSENNPGIKGSLAGESLRKKIGKHDHFFVEERKTVLAKKEKKPKREKRKLITFYGSYKKTKKLFRINPNKIFYEDDFICSGENGCGERLNVKILGSENSKYIIAIDNILLGNNLASLSWSFDKDENYGLERLNHIQFFCPYCKNDMGRGIEYSTRDLITIGPKLFDRLKKYSAKKIFQILKGNLNNNPIWDILDETLGEDEVLAEINQCNTDGMMAECMLWQHETGKESKFNCSFRETNKFNCDCIHLRPEERICTSIEAISDMNKNPIKRKSKKGRKKKYK